METFACLPTQNSARQMLWATWNVLTRANYPCESDSGRLGGLARERPKSPAEGTPDGDPCLTAREISHFRRRHNATAGREVSSDLRRAGKLRESNGSPGSLESDPHLQRLAVTVALVLTPQTHIVSQTRRARLGQTL